MFGKKKEGSFFSADGYNCAGAMVHCGCCKELIILKENEKGNYCYSCMHNVCPECWNAKTKKCADCKE